MEAENFSFLEVNDPKDFPRVSTAAGSTKPYVSCIKIHGLRIIPPLMDAERRCEMRAWREKAVAVERRLSLSRRQVDSGVVSRETSLLAGSPDYLSAVSADESAVSVYKTPAADLSSLKTGFLCKSIEQRVSFDAGREWGPRSPQGSPPLESRRQDLADVLQTLESLVISEDGGKADGVLASTPIGGGVCVPPPPFSLVPPDLRLSVSDLLPSPSQESQVQEDDAQSVEPSRFAIGNVQVSHQCPENPSIEPKRSTRDTEERKETQSCADEEKSVPVGDKMVLPLIRQRSFTVQAGPSSLLRSYIQDNKLELNTDVFQAPKPLARVAARLPTVKGWDSNIVKTTWGSGSNKPFAKPTQPAPRQKKLTHRTRSVSSLPNSAVNSLDKSRQNYGSVDKLNYSKKPRRSLEFSDRKLGSSNRVERRVLPLNSPRNRRSGLKTCHKNPLPVDRDERTPRFNNATLPLRIAKQDGNLTEMLLSLKTEHNKQMSQLLEKQRAEQEKIQEMFAAQQCRLVKEMQRSYPEAFEQTEEPRSTFKQTEEPLSMYKRTEEPRSTERQGNLVPPHSKFLRENVCLGNEPPRGHNNNNSKDSLASFLSVESLLYAGDGNKENMEHLEGPDRSLPHLIISDGDLEIRPCSNDFRTSNILTRSQDSSPRISKTTSSLSEEIYVMDSDSKPSPKAYKMTINVPAVNHNTSQRNVRTYKTENVSSKYESGSVDPSSSLGRVRHSPRAGEKSGEENGVLSVHRGDVWRKYDTLRTRLSDPTDFRPIQRPSKQEKLAASKIVAAARGFLVRRLMKTELVQSMITTIAETLKTAIELRDEILSVGNVNIPQADLDLQKRLQNQLESEYESLYTLFMHSTEAQRVAVIATDRERIRAQLSRPSSGQRPLSSATQRCLKRKQQPEQHGPAPRSRPISGSVRVSRRPLWETAKQRSCVGQSVPTWVANPKSQARQPPPRKPWR